MGSKENDFAHTSTFRLYICPSSGTITCSYEEITIFDFVKLLVNENIILVTFNVRKRNKIIILYF